MRLLMFHDGGTRHLGVAREGAPDEIIDVAAANGSGLGAPADILGVIDGGAQALDRLRELAASSPGNGMVRALADLTLLPPFDPPRGNVLAIGRNYQKHAEETARAANTPSGRPPSSPRRSPPSPPRTRTYASTRR